MSLKKRTGFEFAGEIPCLSRDTVGERRDLRTTTLVHSISAPIYDLLRKASGPVCRLGVFRRSLDLLIDEQVVALGLPELRNGPFHVVVQQLPARPFPKECSLHWKADILQLGPWQLYFPATLRVWNPRPRWESLDLQPATLAALREFVLQPDRALDRCHSPFYPLLMGQLIPEVSFLMTALRNGDLADIRAGSAQLAGWGPGLTPSGDDFLAGVMLSWWANTGRAEIPAAIYQGAAARTNRISRAFLCAARDGLADERWQLLLAALTAGQRREWEVAARHVLAFGATSGLDMFLGFLEAAEICSKA
ncbi:MAG TPA: DUF2877 domain-containing protein [Thermoflexia bacterium]|nr:DUF2877 domain-containing protein [Thermoflexia bacterium]